MRMTKSILDITQAVLHYLFALPRFSKQAIFVLIDISLCVLTVWIAFYLRLGEFVSLSGNAFSAVAISIALLLPIFKIFGLYRVIFRYSGWQSIYSVLLAIAVYGLLYACVITFIGINGIPRTIGIIQPLLLFFLVVGLRTSALLFLKHIIYRQRRNSPVPKALVYGAGSAGRQLVSALENTSKMQVLGFIDDDNRLHGNILNNQLIFSPDDLPFLIKSKGISHVLLAIPSASRYRKNEILKQVGSNNVDVRTLPSVTDLADGRVTVSDLRNPEIEDLLGRDSVKPNYRLLSKKIKNKVVLVTGAGGSIGSELCRQIIKLKPKKLLILDNSEFALYSINEELEFIIGSMKFKDKKNLLVPLLASVQDSKRMLEIMQFWEPNTVYHAAAYKHVPLVEKNLVEGIKNNVIGTLNTAQIAIEKRVSDFVLISTDKAVRPTSVMGASKRLAELCLQALCAQQLQTKTTSSTDEASMNKSALKTNTKLSMVRFGNVLNSSGSVIPRFRKQIKKGGPITLTHPEITRYFMTIPEAAQLVIQATAMAEGGDVFILDMGEPIKIAELARRMVELSGLSVRDNNNPDGDIEILVSGLRPGEKLYEELLLGDNPEPTIHQKIQRSRDPFISWKELQTEIDNLKILLNQNKIEAILNLLQKLVTGYKPRSKI